MRLSPVFIGVVSGLFSALNWMADEVEHLGLRAGFVAPVLVILLVLMRFIDKVNKEGTIHGGSDEAFRAMEKAPIQYLGEVDRFHPV